MATVTKAPETTRTVDLTIDGRPVTVPEGTTILDAAASVGIEIPVLCHDERYDPVGVCRLCAVDVGGRVYAAAFGIGAACVGAAGALVSPIVPFQPAGGLTLSVASFNIVIIGGMGSLVGAFVGGLLVSVAESLGAVFLAPSMKELVSFSLLIVILLFRPAGLFGKRGA